MTNGTIEIENGFAVKDFETGRISFELGTLSFPSYDDAVESCFGRYYPRSYRRYLRQAGTLDTTPDADTWENMIYANDPNGIWDGEQKKYRNVTSMDRGAATAKEIAYVDALDATYTSLVKMAARSRVR